MKNINEEKLKLILLREHYVTEEDLARAQAYAKKHHSSYIEYLESEGILTPDLLGQAISEATGIPYADLNSRPPIRAQVLEIPQALGVKFRTVVFGKTTDSVIVTTDLPLSIEPPAEIIALFPGKKVSQAYSLSADIDAALLHYKKPLSTRFEEILKQEKQIASVLTEQLFTDALELGASDIHFEPHDEDVVVRFRVDGVLREVGRIPKVTYGTVINRIKVLSQLPTDDHFSALDGAIRYRHGETVVDMRVSIVPTVNGETIVIRLLGHYVQHFTFSNLGLFADDQKRLKQQVKKPFGMIVVTGPTGSGKTTTLYGFLKFLNQPDINITTIEDPVEYKILGINQIQVNLATNLTFAKGLKSIIRQDPNIILVGEIRDKETAEIAVNAALTGHLLLSTFHATDASTAVVRMLEIGLEPFLLASTLELVVAQRLVRKICESCRQSASITPEAKKLGIKTVYQGKGCPVCNQTGYKGRTAIFEMIEITPEMKELIITRPTSRQVWQLAKKQETRSMFEDGLEKVKNGVTTFEELMRVVLPPTTQAAS